MSAHTLKNSGRRCIEETTLHREVGNWDYESSRAIIESRGSDFTARMRAMALAAVIYLIWKERNYKIFRQCGQNWQHTLNKVGEAGEPSIIGFCARNGD